MVDTHQVSKKVIELELLSAAEQAAKNLQLHAFQINESRELTDDVTNPLADSGLFRLLVPTSVGGYEIGYLMLLKIVGIIARADGSAGWCLNQNNVLSTLSAFMPKDLAREIWTDRRAVLSNGPPVGSYAVPVREGYI